MKIHMVKSGDSMYTIAEKYGVTMEQLIAFNPQISNPDQIDVGMKVKIPSAGVHDGSPSMEHTHKHIVVQGDSLWKIAKAWGLPLKALVDANPQLKNPSVLLTGEVVYIPKQGSMDNPAMNPSATNMNASHSMNENPTVSQAPNMPNTANSLSPAYTPLPAVEPQPNVAAQPIAEVPTPKPAEQKMQFENNMPMFEKTNEESLNNHPPEPNKEMMNVYSSESLFMQYNVPAVEANTNVNNPPPAYQQPTWNAPEMPQWEPTSNKNNAAPVNAAPNYAAKPDCGCGCGGKSNVMPYANEMPYNVNTMPFNANAMPYSADTIPYNANAMPYSANDAPFNANTMSYNMNAMPDCSYPTPYSSSMPSYYVPQPMLAYSTQPQEQQAPMQFPVPPSAASPYGHMMPCYPMGTYGDMGYLHGMQTPYSPWMSPNENMSPNQSHAENSNNPAAFNEQMSGVLNTNVQETPSKKQAQVPRKPAGRTQQKQDSRTVLHEFLQKKSGQGASNRENKLNEPWMNR